MPRMLRTGVTPVLLCLAVGCASNKQTSQERAEAARALFEQTTKSFHIPSADAKGTEKARLQRQAAAGYERLLRQYPEQDQWAAQALRSIGNIRVMQGRTNDAVRAYSDLGRKYPEQWWEVVMAWKSAADLLWDAGRTNEAKSYYERIVKRFDQPESPAVVKTIVRGSRSRLGIGPRKER